jgi:dUTP pyrophosphatase
VPGRLGRSVAGTQRAIVFETVADAPSATVPRRATGGSACYDVAAAEAAELTRGTVALVRTGFRVRCPAGTFLEMRPRSGLSSRGVLMVNAPGTIDRDYAGEVKVPLTYLFDGVYRIEVGDRIGQLRLVEDLPARFRTGTVRPLGARRGGFGSTGR